MFYQVADFYHFGHVEFRIAPAGKRGLRVSCGCIQFSMSVRPARWLVLRCYTLPAFQAAVQQSLFCDAKARLSIPERGRNLEATFQIEELRSHLASP